MSSFFISYTQADRGWAEWIAWQIQVAGHFVTLQDWDFRPGQNFVQAIDKALSTSDHTIAVVSQAYLASVWCNTEWAAALSPSGEGRTLIPVVVARCTPTGLLKGLVSIDVTALDEAGALQALHRGIQPGRAVPTTAPPFPEGRSGPVPVRPPFPRDLPAIWNLRPPNRNFTGREEMLANLRRALTAGDPDKPALAAIHGLGGMGKTQIALAYAHLHGRDYDIVWWLRAEDPSSLADDYTGLAAPLGLPVDEEAELTDIAEAVRSELDARSKWLLIFDDVRHPDDVRKYLPSRSGGHVLFTSRHESWLDLATPLKVKGLPQAEAVQLLLRRSGQTDEALAAELAKELGCLPLALMQAAAYIDGARVSFQQYLKLFRTRRQGLWGREVPPSDYRATVATTWDLSWQNVQSQMPSAAEVLSLCAFLAPDDIPRALLMRAMRERSGDATEPPDDLVLNEAVTVLCRYSLGDATSEVLSVHKLVQAVIRDKQSPDEKREWVDFAARIIASELRSTARPLWKQLLPHAQAVVGHARELDMPASQMLDLLSLVGRCSIGLHGELAGARKLLEEALQIAETTYGPDHSQVAACLVNLSSALVRQGDLEGARGLLERALRVDEAAYGQEHYYVAAVLRALGGVLEKLGDLQGARVHLERALAVDERLFGSESTHVAASLLALGGVLEKLGDLQGARVHLERALALDERLFGSESTHVAASLLTLGGVLHKQGEFRRAKELFERALKISEAQYGPTHNHVGVCLMALGGVLQGLRDLEGARVVLVRAVKLSEANHGPDHSHVAACLMALGGVLERLGELDEARAVLERALAITERNSAPDHPNLAANLMVLGGVLDKLRDHRGARVLLERALLITEANFGPDHDQVAASLMNLGIVLHKLGDPGARAFLERALAITEANHGPNHPYVAANLTSTSGVLESMGDLPGARVLLERALRIDESNHGPDHPRVAATAMRLARLLQRLEELEAARTLVERALAIDEKTWGPEHRHVAMDVAALGRLCERLGDLERARALFERALAIDEKAHGPEHRYVAAALTNLGRVLEGLGRADEAQALYERASRIRRSRGAGGSRRTLPPRGAASTASR